jgi:hypothetical protein
MYKIYSNDSLVWHIMQIIQNLFQLDVHLDLADLNLKAPPEGWVEPDIYSSNNQSDSNNKSKFVENKDWLHFKLQYF